MGYPCNSVNDWDPTWRSTTNSPPLSLTQKRQSCLLLSCLLACCWQLHLLLAQWWKPRKQEGQWVLRHRNWTTQSRHTIATILISSARHWRLKTTWRWRCERFGSHQKSENENRTECLSITYDVHPSLSSWGVSTADRMRSERLN